MYVGGGEERFAVYANTITRVLQLPSSPAVEHPSRVGDMATQLPLGDVTLFSIPDQFDLFVSVIIVLYVSLVTAIGVNNAHIIYRYGELWAGTYRRFRY